jgi:two-component system, chemotaxis family, protein-glutamate methylesterase/glutaminase
MVALPQTNPVSGYGARVSVAVVDDSVVVRGLLSKWLAETPTIEVAGTFRSGREIIDALPGIVPRIILLDLDMPDMDGITALPLILQKSPQSRVIVVSSLSVHGAELTMKSLMAGATDYLPKPSNHREVSTSADFRQALIAKVLAVGGVRQSLRAQTPSPAAPTRAPLATTPAPRPSGLFARNSATGTSAPSAFMKPAATPAAAPAAPSVTSLAPRPSAGDIASGAARPLLKIRPKLVVIGASTGGPQALVAMLAHMKNVPNRVPIVIAQHMPPIFGSIFAGHLKQHAGLPACEAEDGKPLRPGLIYLAPGGSHTIISRRADGQFVLGMLPAEARGPWRPSIDLLFSSAAECFGQDALAIALTGMGRDGAEGATHLVRRGANVIVQDEASSVVWGIPGSIAELGLAAAQLPPEKLGDLAQSLVEGGQP